MKESLPLFTSFSSNRCNSIHWFIFSVSPITTEKTLPVKAMVLGNKVSFDNSTQFCDTCLITHHLSHLSRHSCPVATATIPVLSHLPCDMSYHSCPVTPVLCDRTAMKASWVDNLTQFCDTCLITHVLWLLSQLSCHSCPVTAVLSPVLSQLSCNIYIVTLVLSPVLSQLSCHICLVTTVLSPVL